MHTTPPSLLQRLRSPEQGDVWNRFAMVYTPLLHDWAKRLGLGEADVSDLVQEVFLVLVRRLPDFTYDETLSFRGWLRTVMRNKWHEWSRQRARNLSLGSDAADVADRDGFAELEEAEYHRHIVQGALRTLEAEFSAQHWQAFTRYVLDGQPVERVASELGLSANAIYLVKSRVLRRLRSEIEGLLG